MSGLRGGGDVWKTFPQTLDTGFRFPSSQDLSPPPTSQDECVSSPTAQTPLRRELTGLESTLFGQMPPKASPLGQRKFTEPQRKRLREVFDLLDTDGSDELDYTELKDALQKFGVKLSLKELKNIWVSADKDANSGINFEDFCDSIEKLPTTLLDRRESMIKLQEVLTGANEDEDGKKGKGKQTPSSCSLM